MNRVDDFILEGLRLSAGAFTYGRVSVCRRRVSPDAAGPIWKLAADEVVVPAFHDHHTHLLGTHRPQRGPDLSGCGSKETCLEALARWIEANPGDGPVIGEGWDESGWVDARPLVGSDIDPVEAARPVALRRVCGHVAVVNGVAWNLLAPEGEESDPATGTLKESLSMGLPQRWPATQEEDLQGARNGQEAAFRFGVAGVDEMGRPETFHAFLALHEEGGLLLRVNHYFPLASVGDLSGSGLTPGRVEGKLRVAGLKGFLDGSIGGRTAAMGCGYVDAPPGRLLWQTEALLAAVVEGVRLGFSIALHAIGLRAVEQALDVFERVAVLQPPEGSLRIEHAEEMDDSAIERAARLRVSLSMQPNFTARWQGKGGLYERTLGASQGVSLNRFGSVASRARLFFGSDTMPFGPMAGLGGAVHHPDPRERLAAPSALRAYMPGGIGPSGARDLLAEGEEADLVILRIPDGDTSGALLAGKARVVWTAVSGRVVFCDPSAGAPAPLRGRIG